MSTSTVFWILIVFVAAVVSSFPTEEAVMTQPPETECAPRTPCGWAVYYPFTRKINYFMKNTCYCGKGKACLRAGDDISVSAFVHRCMDKPEGYDENETQPPDYPIF